MLQTSLWQDIDLKVLGELHLDTENVRLEHDDNKVEADILNDLFANEDVLSLLRDITRVGFLTHELPVVVKRRKKYVVVEGNRRVAALKAIQNPMLVPAFQARVKDAIKGLPQSTIKSLAHIRVKVAPTQDQANELIAALHTGNQRKPWSPARQAAFFQAQIDAGRTYDDLKRRYPTADVAKFVFRSCVLDLFQNAEYKDPELTDFVKSPSWRRSSSTIERIYDTRAFIDLTGASLSDHGVFSIKLSPEQLTAMASVIVRGLKDGDLNTRTINKVTNPRFVKLIDDIREAIEPAGMTASPAGASGAGAGNGSTSSGKSPTRSGKAPAKGRGRGSGSKARTHININLVVPDSYSVALQRQYGELTVLNIQQMPNTAYLALRAILEKSIKQYAEVKNEDIAASVKGKGGYVQLHHALEWFENYITKVGPKSLLQPIRKVRTSDKMNWGNYSSSKAAMDAANHNHKFLVDPAEVLALWDSIEPLLRELVSP